MSAEGNAVLGFDYVHPTCLQGVVLNCLHGRLYIYLRLLHTQCVVDGMPHNIDNITFNKVLLAKIVRVPLRTNHLK
jgi:hypothetical protein